MTTAIWVSSLIGALIVASILLRKFGGYAPGWRIRCAACGHHRPAAEAGIVRIAAVGTKHTVARCPACGRAGHAIIERDDPATDAELPAPQASESDNTSLPVH